MGILRLILALSVVAVHSSPILGFALVGGQVAVQAFYIISGFYMSLILNEKYIGSGSYKLFITNRFLRLFPVFWVVLGLVVIFALFQIAVTHGQSTGGLQAYVDYISHGGQVNIFSFFVLIGTNLLLFGQDIMMFLGINPATGHFFFTQNFQLTEPKVLGFLLVPQAWTIGVELLFYVVAPFLVRRKIWIVICVILASLGLRAYLYNHGLNYDPWTYRFFPLELAFFLFGNIAYRIYEKIKDKNIKREWLWSAFGLISVATLIYQWVNIPEKNVTYFALLVLLIPFIFLLTRRSEIDKKIGELSYPIYISHLFVLSVMLFFPWYQVPVAQRGIILALCTIIFAILLNKYVAAPIERFRKARAQKQLSLDYLK